MTAYATVDDCAAIYPPAATDPDRTTALLEQAAGLIDGLAPGVVDMVPTPGYVITVNANSAVRALVNPLGVKSEQLASYSTTYGDTRVGVYLTDDEIAGLAALPGALAHSGVYDVRTPRYSDETSETYWEPGLWTLTGRTAVGHGRSVQQPRPRLSVGRVARRR